MSREHAARNLNILLSSPRKNCHTGNPKHFWIRSLMSVPQFRRISQPVSVRLAAGGNSWHISGAAGYCSCWRRGSGQGEWQRARMLLLPPFLPFPLVDVCIFADLIICILVFEPRKDLYLASWEMLWGIYADIFSVVGACPILHSFYLLFFFYVSFIYAITSDLYAFFSCYWAVCFQMN